MTLVVIVYALAGAAAVGVVWTYERALQRLVSQTVLDLLHFSLHPVNAGRLAVTCGLVLFHAAVVWTAAAIALAPEIVWRTRRAIEWRASLAGSWLIGVVVAIVLVRPSAPGVPLVPAGVAVLVAGASAVTVTSIRSRFRRASQSARIFTVFLALLVPSIAMYPSVLSFATDAKERLVATEYGPQAASQREDLEQRVRNSLAEIDAGPSLKEFVAGVDVATPTTDRAFLAWSRTDLATYRLTSAVELFNALGRVVSRFALSLLLAFLPAMVLGGLLHDWIKAALFSPWVVVCSLILGGVAILIIEGLRTACATCASPERCAHDLAAYADDPDWPDWRDYCPNAAKLNMLIALQFSLVIGEPPQ